MTSPNHTQNESSTAQTDLNLDRPSSGAVLSQGLQQEAEKREKSKDLRPLFRLWPYFLRQKSDFAFMLVFLLLSSAMQLALTSGVKTLVDTGFVPSQKSSLDQGFLVVGAMALILAAATALRYFFITKLGERIVAHLRIDVFGHVLSLDPAFFVKVRSGEVLSRLTTDIQIIENLVASAVSIALRNILGLMGGLVMLMLVSWKLTLLVLAIFPVVLVPLFAYGKQVSLLTAKTQDRFAGAVGLAQESLEALETVQSFVREVYAKTRFSTAITEAYQLSLKRMSARALMTAMIIGLVFGGVALVLWLGAQDVLNGTMSVGTLIQFVMLAVLVAGSVANLSETWGDLQKAAGAMTRIDDLLSAQPMIKAPQKLKSLTSPVRGDIRFENVGFSYPSRPDIQVLQGLDLHVSAGETVAIVGPSGGGKSSLFKLLLRFYDPTMGRILLDDTDLRDMDPAHFRGQMAIVAQDMSLFSGSGRDNIAYGDLDADDAAIRQAADGACASEFLDKLPSGFDHPLGEKAKTLSGGQKQRLAIARAMVRKAPILLLDEATSALDTENERLVAEALDHAMEGRTTLIIAHRISTIRRADRIIVMDGGQIVESGTHAELMLNDGLFARLARLQ
jgi:ATP-binding cassette subfamily B protein